MVSKDDINRKLDEEFKKIEKEITKPNIFVVGGTGVGKSTLINTIFGEEVADISAFEPETRGIIRHLHKDVVLFDTEGLELDVKHENTFNELVLGGIKQRQKGPEKDKVHLIWYVIAGSSDRITDYQIEIYKKLKEFNIPLAVVYTKCDEASEDGIDAMIKRLQPSLSYKLAVDDKDNPPFFVSNTNDEDLLPNDLVNWSIKQLPNALKFGFISSQIVNAELKYEEAKSIIYQHSIGNGVVGFTPVPFSDAPILIASQMGMLARIIRLYGLDNFDLKFFMTNTGASIIISNLGKSAVASLLKFIPILGTVVGGVINAGVASAITFAMGTSLNVLLNKIFINVLNGNTENAESIINNFSSMFSSEFNTQFNIKRNE